MNTTKYLQTDSKWSELGYPQKPCTIGNSGCGEVAICNAIIEMEKYAKYTPATIQPYCKQFAAANCEGTFWSGIPKMMEHYGLTEVKEHQTMPELFKELAKGNRVAIYIMGSRRGGTKGVQWSSSGHIICSTSYRYRNGEHEVYVKDSYSNSSLRNEWLGYSTHLRGDVLKVWSGKLSGKLSDGTTVAEVKGTSKATRYKVIDVSEYQKTIDWKKVKADGVVGAIIRYADGDYLDTMFERNMENAKANGLHVGAYIFSRAKTKAEAEKEATRLYNACKKYECDMPLYIDLEAKGLEKYANTVANAFINKMKSLGAFCGVYANLNWWNNYLTKVTPPARWVAQYNDKCTYKGGYGMWQHSSSGSVKGISGRVDMDWCYVDYWNKIKPTPTPTKKGYSGKFPTYRIKKTNAQVIADTIAWLKYIASNNNFHYGHGQASHRNGCYFCGTQPARKKNSGMKKWQTTYCCNPFVGAGWAHGGCIPRAMALCRDGNSWDFSDGGKNTYEDCDLFTKLGRPSKSKLKAGDVMCSDGHVALYIGNGQYIDAGHEDDNVVGSSSWNTSIAVRNLTDRRYGMFERVYRYNSKVDADMCIFHGELSDRVKDLYGFLNWYFDGKVGKADRFYGDKAMAWVKKFQDAEMGAGQGDGIVGPRTIEAMRNAKK